MQYAEALQAAGRKLTGSDAIHILGAVYFFLREKDVCVDLADARGNNSAQGAVAKLRNELFTSFYRSAR
jgi:hypothetical protein